MRLVERVVGEGKDRDGFVDRRALDEQRGPRRGIPAAAVPGRYAGTAGGGRRGRTRIAATGRGGMLARSERDQHECRQRGVAGPADAREAGRWHAR